MRVKPDGEKIRTLRVVIEPNAAEFARKAGISLTTLRSAERGALLSPHTARKIGRALDVDPRTFARAISSRPA